MADKENFWGAFFMGKEVFESLFLDQFENPLKTTNSRVKIDANGTNLSSSIVFGKKGVINCSASERLKYSYDKMGNISAIFKNGTLIVKYTYDHLNRIVREDNKTLKKTWVFAYDNNGNIITKKETEFTLKENTEDCVFTEHLYEYDGDELVYYDGKTCCYMAKTGKPSIYKNNNVYWSGENVVEYGNNTFMYDACGRRLTKNNLVYTYDSNGKLIRQSNGLEFFYDHTGVAGMKYNGSTYIYRKDVQGNIIALLDSSGGIVVKYAYDAWGNVSVMDNNGVIISDSGYIGNINPFRYRGYYYDADTKLYYLKTRYYDPEAGRFVSQDSIEYLNSDTINGLNLYAYCVNNPVMNVDPNGTIGILAGILIGILIGAVIVGTGVAIYAGVTAYNNGARGWDLFGAIAEGFLTGAVIGGIIGGLIAAFIYAAPAIASFLSSSFSFGGFALASEGAAAITLTGAQIAAAGLAALIGLGVMFASTNRPGDNRKQNEQYREAMRRLGYNKEDWQWRYGHDHLPNESLGFKDLLDFLKELFSKFK